MSGFDATAVGTDFEGAWVKYAPTLTGVLLSGVAPDPPTLGDSVVTGAFTRYGRTVVGRFQFRMGETFEPSPAAGAYAVGLPFPPFVVDNVGSDADVPQLIGSGWAIDHEEDEAVVDRLHFFKLVQDVPWEVNDASHQLAIMFLHGGSFSAPGQGNPLGRFPVPPPPPDPPPTVVGVPFEFAAGDVLAGFFRYQARAD